MTFGLLVVTLDAQGLATALLKQARVGLNRVAYPEWPGSPFGAHLGIHMAQAPVWPTASKLCFGSIPAVARVGNKLRWSNPTNT